MACDCKKGFEKLNGEVKKIRQSVQELSTVLSSLNKTLGEQLDANKEEFEKKEQPCESS